MFETNIFKKKNELRMYKHHDSKKLYGGRKLSSEI